MGKIHVKTLGVKFCREAIPVFDRNGKFEGNAIGGTEIPVAGMTQTFGSATVRSIGNIKILDDSVPFENAVRLIETSNGEIQYSAPGRIRSKHAKNKKKKR